MLILSLLETLLFLNSLPSAVDVRVDVRPLVDRPVGGPDDGSGTGTPADGVGTGAPADGVGTGGADLINSSNGDFELMKLSKAEPVLVESSRAGWVLV